MALEIPRFLLSRPTKGLLGDIFNRVTFKFEDWEVLDYFVAYQGVDSTIHPISRTFGPSGDPYYTTKAFIYKSRFSGPPSNGVHNIGISIDKQDVVCAMTYDEALAQLREMMQRIPFITSTLEEERDRIFTNYAEGTRVFRNVIFPMRCPVVAVEVKTDDPDKSKWGIHAESHWLDVYRRL